MNPKIDRSDFDYNTIKWDEDRISIARQSWTHVRITRSNARQEEPLWSISIDVTSGHQELHVAYGNRLAFIGRQHVLAITCGEIRRGGSLHNFQLHYISDDGKLLWSLPWQTIQRYTLIDSKLLVVRYVSPPEIWIPDTPLEAYLLDPKTGESLHFEPIVIPDELQPHYQSGYVTDLKAYLVWKQDQLVVTVRPYFRPQYTAAHLLTNRGSFKQTLSFTQPVN